jgi:hypothetical protein
MLTRDASISPAIAELPIALLVENRTGPSISSAELAALAVNPPSESAAVPLTLHMALLGAMLGTGGPYGWTSAEQLIRWQPAAAVARATPAKFVVSTLSGSDVAIAVHARALPPPVEPTVASPQPAKIRPTRAGITPADELRGLTRLSPQLLANLFGVSRTTYYKWIEGTTPRDARYNHLLEVLSHLRDVSDRISRTCDIAAWLRTPVAPGGKTPLDYLRDQRYRAFRGFGLRVAGRQMDLGAPQPLFSDTTSTLADRADARRRINPTPRLPDSEADDA